MGVINQLSVEISNKIAAGEVVERPASVVKELVENAIDAGANVITVEIENGGTGFIRVSDNGCGMTGDDAQKCFLRHATSKIKTAEDLDAIYTLGFRGEALSSIGAVSEVELLTKRPQDSIGTRICFAGGEMIKKEEAGGADGTTIVVKNLFFNTPARMKFLKKDATEAGYIADIMSRFILAHTEISFKLTRDSKEIYYSPGDSSLKNALYCVYGREYAKAVIDVDYEMDGIKIKGVAGKSETARANRGYQSFYVNKRYIKSPAITRALEEAYKNQIMIGKFPMAVLNVEVNPNEIDINVHPTKLEVKFSDDSLVYRAVYHGVKNALYSVSQVPEVERQEPSPEPTPVLPREASGWQDNKTPTQRGGFVHYERKMPEPSFTPIKSEKYMQETTSFTPRESYEYLENKRETLVSIGDSPITGIREQKEVVRGIESLPRNFKIIGQIFDTYILIERDDSLLMIDQHAAHERIKYEELKAELAKRTPTPQRLIAHVPVELSPAEKVMAEENIEKLLGLGFEIEEKKGEFYITAVPSPMDEESMVAVFVELVTAFGDNKQNVIDAAKERLTYTIACKAAIKANRRLTEIEMYALANKVFDMENINTCPHGRPIVIKMTKKEIEKEFGRTL
ncbi:MAG: DNA mismatch repair endonuclease MutL [Clostridia bacterium]|nr:DNA mismatch repair endonuclease MutL [Clostridia bacterium]MBQ8637409.1 DNA mismatch repair endonuclease MutL [Clostridia bacterium]